jgi:hypothetical protein
VGTHYFSEYLGYIGTELLFTNRKYIVLNITKHHTLIKSNHCSWKEAKLFSMKSLSGGIKWACSGSKEDKGAGCGLPHPYYFERGWKI